MTIIQLSDKEQAILDGAGAEIMAAQERYRVLSEEMQRAEQNVSLAMARLQGSYRSLMTMRDLDPDAYRAEWNADTRKIVITEIAMAGSGELSP